MTRSTEPAARPLWVYRLLAVGLLLLEASVVNGGTADTNTGRPLLALGEANSAWEEFRTAFRTVVALAPQNARPTEAQVEDFRRQKALKAAEAAQKARDFYARFPNHPQSAEARMQEFDLLNIAVACGATNKVPALEDRLQERLKDPGLTDDERYRLRVNTMNSYTRLNPSGENASLLAQEEEDVRALIKEFPARERGYRLLLDVADRSDATRRRKLINEVAESNASAEIRSIAQGSLRRMDFMGKPLPIKFSAVNGGDVDVTGMSGKVVLIYFWATWCGPCVEETPNLKAAYERLHPKGFEIIGISLDTDKTKLMSFLKSREIRWPQFFDGKKWGNKFGEAYGVHGVPAMWLVDKKGNLRDLNARGDLDAKVEHLLAE